MHHPAQENLKKVTEWLEAQNKGDLTEFLSQQHPAEVAGIIDFLPDSEKREIFALLDAPSATEVIVELSDYSLETVLEGLQTSRVAEIVDELPSDEATDIIAELPAAQAREVLSRIDLEDSREVRILLRYDEDTAGGIMQLELVAAKSSWTVAEAIDSIRAKRHEVENPMYVFVVGEENILLGQLPLSRLILADPLESMRVLMEPCPLVVEADDDQEQVAILFRRYDVMTAPVVDNKGRLLGRITIDDVMDVVEEEASEDFMRMAGAPESETIHSYKAMKISMLRLPWLLANLFCGSLAGWIAWQFERTLHEAIFLVSFMPVVMAMGGNVGVQSSTIVVRGFATGELNNANISRLLFREFRVALILGISCGLTAGILAYVMHGRWTMGVVVFCSMLIGMTVAALWGAVSPAMFNKLKIDPAVAAGPVVTTTTDVISVIIYFSIATLFYRFWVG